MLGPEAALTPEQLRANLVDKKADAHASLVLVKPGDPDNSFLLRKLEGNLAGLPCEPTCGVRMPQGSLPLEAKDIDLVRRWIANGAQDD